MFTHVEKDHREAFKTNCVPKKANFMSLYAFDSFPKERENSQPLSTVIVPVNKHLYKEKLSILS